MLKCPNCGSDKVVPIIFGKPGQELIESADRGEVKLGGCSMPASRPKRYCKDCKCEFSFIDTDKN